MGIFEKFNKGLKKTRNSMSGAIDIMLHGKNEIDDDLYDELEEILIMGDVGMNTAAEICEKLRDYVAKKNLRKPDQVKAAIKEIVAEMLQRRGYGAYHYAVCHTRYRRQRRRQNNHNRQACRYV